jgi:predicted nucleic acid-binding Zn ribbon protein
MSEQELKKEQFIAKAMANKANFELHKNLIEKHLCIGGAMYIKDLKVFYERQVVDNQLLINLMEYAESYAEEKNSKLYSDIEAHKNRITVLQNLNTKYREKLGISNEPIDALGLIVPFDSCIVCGNQLMKQVNSTNLHCVTCGETITIEKQKNNH